AALEQIASRRELGNLTVAAEEARAALGFQILDAAGADIRYAFRGLRRDRAFTVVAVASLALGIAANVGVFGLMDALLWRELPVRDADQLVSFENTSRSYFGYSEFAKQSGSALQDVIAQSPVLDSSIDLGSGPAHAQVEFVSGNYFNALGVVPASGRLLLPSDDELQHPGRVATLSYAYWRQAFNGDPAVIGRSLYLGEGRFEIVGVTPDDFFGLSVGEAPDVWVPITTHGDVFPGTNWLAGRNTNWLEIFGRLRAGVTRSQAQAMLTPVSLEIDIERNGLLPTPVERKEMLKDPIRLEPAAKGISELRARFSKPLHAVFGMLGVGLSLRASMSSACKLHVRMNAERNSQFGWRLALADSG
ncbi:MAG: ABC transporter permease, partial [Acidobacteriota bacterium]|nr:ABC transporter permease [Acidobacteriota bacterium]